MASPVDIVAAAAVAGLARLVTGVRGIWLGCGPDPVPRIYFANHNSHGDFVLIWTVLPPALRRTTRPVAGSDYWMVNGLRRFIGERVFRAVLIDRNPETRQEDPIALMAGVLNAGPSPDPVSGRDPQYRPGAIAPVQERALSPRESVSRGGPRAGVDRESQPGHAERRDRTGPDLVYGDLRGSAADL